MAVWYVTTTSWAGSGSTSGITYVENDSPIDGGVIATSWGSQQVWRVQSFKTALDNYAAGDVITLDPDAVAFVDAAGFRLHTVTIPLDALCRFVRSVTVAGGAYRLRFDGLGANKISSVDNITFVDVDFVRFYGSYVLYLSAAASFTRCLFAGCESSDGATSYPLVRTGSGATYRDCAFVANSTNANGNDMTDATSTYTIERCVGYFRYFNSVDSINLFNKDQTAVNAIGFVSPPKVYDTSNPGYYTDGTAWTNTDWESVDLRLLSTSSYATGGTSVTSSDEIYDLAGNRRNVGGALGAYECLSDVTHWASYLPGYGYTVTREDGGVNVVAAARRKTAYTTAVYDVISLDGDVDLAQYLSASSVWTELSITTDRSVMALLSTSINQIRLRSASTGAWTTITYYALPTDVAEICDGSFGDRRFWTTTRSGVVGASSAPASSSVCYCESSEPFASTTSTVQKIYVPGWTHVDLGDNGGGAELVLGLGATATTSGALTYKPGTTTSAAILEKITLESGAKLTLKDGATTGDWTIPTGTAIVFNGGSFSGALPSTCELAGSVAITSTSSNVALTLQSGATIASGSTLTLTGGTFSASTASINGALTLTNTTPTVATSLTLGGSLSYAGSTVWQIPTLTTTNGASITLTDGAALSVTTTATLGATTTLSGSGYFATPTGTDTTGVSAGSGVVLCEYGAGVTALSSSNIGASLYALTWTKTNATPTVCLEYQNGGSWTLVSASQAGTSATISGQTARIFDGAAFTTVTAYNRTRAYELAATIPFGILRSEITGGAIL